MGCGLWNASFPDKPKVVTRHSGVSNACLPVPMVRHSPLHASTSASGKGLSELLGEREFMAFDSAAPCRAVSWHDLVSSDFRRALRSLPDV